MFTVQSSVAGEKITKKQISLITSNRESLVTEPLFNTDLDGVDGAVGVISVL